ncbi:MAG: imidazole glycerol phosphate synthase cyclase subunit [Gemmatimonadales bacterium]
MLTRIIPRLDIKGPNLVKGIHLEGLRVLGKPEHFARHYYEQGADELLFIDVVASLYERNSLLDIVERTAREIFIPLTVGGGLRTLDDIREVLRAGADKVAINTAAVRRPEFVREAVQRFGASTIVIAIEAIRRSEGAWEAYTDNGRERSGLDAVEWAASVTDLGAGELLVTSIEREGTGRGFDLELTRTIASAVPIPVIACGGAGNVDHVAEVLELARADAACVGSLLHYDYVQHHAPQGEFRPEINLAHLHARRGFEKIQSVGLAQLKRELEGRGIHSRPPVAQASHD